MQNELENGYKVAVEENVMSYARDYSPSHIANFSSYLHRDERTIIRTL